MKDQRRHTHIGGHEQNNIDEAILQKYIEEDEEEESLDNMGDESNLSKGQTDLHRAAAMGSVTKCKKVLGDKPTDIIHVRDENGWQAIHEAARGGNLDVLKYLVSIGADPSAVTNQGRTVLWWARSALPKNHEVIKYLESIHASEGNQLRSQDH